jgi:hypothetical protein
MAFTTCLIQNGFINMALSKWLQVKNDCFKVALSKWLYQNGFIKITTKWLYQNGFFKMARVKF